MHKSLINIKRFCHLFSTFSKYFFYYQILILDPGKVTMPSYVTVNMDADEKSIHIVNLCLEEMIGKCKKLHEWVFNAASLKSFR